MGRSTCLGSLGLALAPCSNRPAAWSPFLSRSRHRAIFPTYSQHMSNIFLAISFFSAIHLCLEKSSRKDHRSVDWSRLDSASLGLAAEEIKALHARRGRRCRERMEGFVGGCRKIHGNSPRKNHGVWSFCCLTVCFEKVEGVDWCDSSCVKVWRIVIYHPPGSCTCLSDGE